MKCVSLHVRHISALRHVAHSAGHAVHVLSSRKKPGLHTTHPPVARNTRHLPSRSALLRHAPFDRYIPAPASHDVHDDAPTAHVWQFSEHTGCE